MITKNSLFVVLAAVLIGITANASGEEQAAGAMPEKEKPANYVVLKGGIYSPSMSYELDTFNGGNRRHLDNKTGFTGELAFGHYFLPIFALELGAGYFESKGSPAAQSGETKLKVVPVTASGKILLPIGPVEPYGMFGIGAYFTKLDVSGNIYNFSSSSKITGGLHAGAGININITGNIFLGVEGRYLWTRPSFGGQDVKMDGFHTTADIGFRF